MFNNFKRVLLFIVCTVVVIVGVGIKDNNGQDEELPPLNRSKNIIINENHGEEGIKKLKKMKEEIYLNKMNQGDFPSKKFSNLQTNNSETINSVPTSKLSLSFREKVFHTTQTRVVLYTKLRKFQEEKIMEWIFFHFVFIPSNDIYIFTMGEGMIDDEKKRNLLETFGVRVVEIEEGGGELGNAFQEELEKLKEKYETKTENDWKLLYLNCNEFIVPKSLGAKTILNQFDNFPLLQQVKEFHVKRIYCEGVMGEDDGTGSKPEYMNLHRFENNLICSERVWEKNRKKRIEEKGEKINGEYYLPCSIIHSLDKNKKYLFPKASSGMNEVK